MPPKVFGLSTKYDIWDVPAESLIRFPPVSIRGNLVPVVIPARFVHRLIHLELTTADFSTVHTGNGSLGLAIRRHLDEAEAF